MADPNIQSITFPVSRQGSTTTYVADINKRTGAMDVYEQTPLGNRYFVLKSYPGNKWEPELGPSALIPGNYDDDAKKNILTSVASAANNQRAAYINKSFTQEQKNNLFAGMPRVVNTAPPDPNAGSGGTSESSKPLTQENVNKVAEGIPGRPSRENYGPLYYPKDIQTTDSDVIKFTMIRYGTRSFDTQTLGLSERKFKETEKEKEIKGTVVMSIQPGINDYNYVNWSGETMGMLASAAAGSTLEIIDTGSVSGIANKLTTTFKQEAGLANAIESILAQEAASTKGLLTRISGAMFNNNLELLFMGPQLRQFTFNFKMSPRYKEEADEVRKIIRFFKQGSAVQRSTTNLFLKSPNVFNLEYLYRGKDSSKSLNRIKTCALISVGVDYTPTGSYMTFENSDGSMVSYTLSLTFNELEPIYEDEYQKLDAETIDKTNDSAGIGY